MYLYVDELKASPTYQIITVGRRAINLTAIRPHLYRQLSPAGSLYLRVEDVNENLVAQSETIAISSIGTGSYWHGYVRFNITTQLAPSQPYAIHVVPTGYTYADSAFVGVCNDYDLRKVPATYSPNTFSRAALDLELWENQFYSRRAG